MFQKMFKAPNVPNFTAREKFEREKRKERIYERDKFERQIIDWHMEMKHLLASGEIDFHTFIMCTRTEEQLMWRRVTMRESSRAKSN
jgi:hypothetical protein